MDVHYKPFTPLIERIKHDGKCLEGGILKVTATKPNDRDHTLS